MNYRERTATLKQECTELQKKLDKIISDISETTAEVQRLSEKEKTLKEMKSSLAKGLLEDVINNISRLNENIANLSVEIRKIEDELKKKNKQLQERQTDPSEFIKEQVAKMVPVFWEYVEANKYDISMGLERTFNVKEVTIHIEDSFSGCDVPTGEVEIVDVSTLKRIVKSDEYPFEQKLYEAQCLDSYELFWDFTKWGKGYINMFIRELSFGVAQKSQNESFEISIDVEPWPSTTTISKLIVYITLKFL